MGLPMEKKNLAKPPAGRRKPAVNRGSVKEPVVNVGGNLGADKAVAQGLLRVTSSPEGSVVRGKPVAIHDLEYLKILVDAAGDVGASDIHIQPGKRIDFRIQGDFVPYLDGTPHLTTKEILAWAEYLAAQDIAGGDRKGMDIFKPEGHLHTSMGTKKYRARLAFCTIIGEEFGNGVSVDIRIIPRVIPQPDEVGVPKSIQRLARRKSGLILYIGETGSGKSTAIAALLDMINRSGDSDHMYLVEDPVEFVHHEMNGTKVTQRERYRNFDEYQNAIKDSLRSDPNVILVGELLDAPTTYAVLHAASTGHLVFSTSHAGSATEAIMNLISRMDVLERNQVRTMLAQSLLAVVVQTLVKGVDGKRLPAQEILIIDDNMRDMVRHEDQTQRIAQQLISTPGCQTLEQHLAELVKSGKITREVAETTAKDPDTLEDLLSRD